MNKKITTLSNEEFYNDESVTTEMRISMDDFRWHNQTLEDNMLHIQHRQQETYMVDGFEALDP